MEAGFRSRSSVVGERGDDIEKVDAEIQADDKRQQSLKIGPYSKALEVVHKALVEEPLAPPVKKGK